MCGIAGILTSCSGLELAAPLRRMRDALRHRGPDDEGIEQVALPHGRLGLVHTRLAILDVTVAGHQPMCDPRSGSWIVYNGEAYNHHSMRARMADATFESSGDTESVLAAWVRFGPEALESIRGMFAFGLYDGRRREFWLVRDRLGVKPLYVCEIDGETWAFASELRALLASGLVERRLCPEAVESYLAIGAVPAPWTFVAGVRSVLPGERWRFDLSGPSKSWTPQRDRYWRPGFCAKGTPAPARREAVEELRPTLLDSSRLRMLADVPVGVFLSGGIDSSGVVASLAAQGHRLATFSVAFGERAFDESRHAKRVAEEFGSEHHELSLKPADVLADFENAIAAYDQPSIDGVNSYFISKAVRAAGIKVALSGLGGDELFAGYPYFGLAARLDCPVVRAAARLASATLGRLAPRSVRTTKLAAMAAGDSRVPRYLACREVIGRGRRASLLGLASPGGPPLPADVTDDLAEAVEGLDSVNAHSLLEMSLYMANMLLRDADQMSMAHALEVRVPLLDHVLVEQVASLPGSLKLARGATSRTKGLFVDALPARLPRSVLRRRKMGFLLPWRRWLRQELRGVVADALGDAEALDAAGLRPAAARAMWDDFLNERPGVRETDMLALLHLTTWVRRWGVSLDRPSAQPPAPAGATPVRSRDRSATPVSRRKG